MNDKEKNEIIENIEVAFFRVIGPLTLMSKMDYFKKSHDEINTLLESIVTIAIRFEKEHNLNFLDPEKLLNIYDRFEKIKEEYLYDEDNELSDEIVIWYWEIMNLRKKLIEMELN